MYVENSTKLIFYRRMGACGRGGRCGAEGRFLKKAPQKLFFGKSFYWPM